MTYCIGESQCCGLSEIAEIQTEGPVEETAQNIYNSWDGQPLLVFTAVTRGKYYEKFYKHGDRLKEFIEKNKLGTVVTSHAKVNPNSKNTVRAYLWSVSARGFHRWAKKQPWYGESALDHSYDFG